MFKRLISYSLYDKQLLYWKGALNNVRYARYFYPGWVCRFYVSDEIPSDLINTLKARGAEVIAMGQRINQEATLWRFLAATEAKLDAVIVRDADSCFSKRERLAVQEWLRSDKKFHIMRDHFWHGMKIPGGMWGMRGHFPNLDQLITNWLSCQRDQSFPKGIDQRFLGEVVYPLIAKDVCIHHARRDITDAPSTTYEEERTLPFPMARRSARDFVGRPRGRTKYIIALAIYRKNFLSEYRIYQFTRHLNLIRIPREATLRFYTADNIHRSLIEKLQQHGEVILKTTRHKYEPEYWKLLSLAAENIDHIIIIDFAYLLALCRRAYYPKVLTLLRYLVHFFNLISPIQLSRNQRKKEITKVWVITGFAPIPNVAQLIDQYSNSFNFQHMARYRTFLYQILYPKTSNRASFSDSSLASNLAAFSRLNRKRNLLVLFRPAPLLFFLKILLGKVIAK